MLSARSGRTELTPLHEACIHGHLKIVKEILQFNRGVQLKDRNSNTALHYACKHNHDEIALLLIQHGALLDTINSNGETPLSLANESLKKKLGHPRKPEPSPIKNIPKPIPEPGPSSPPKTATYPSNGPASTMIDSHEQFKLIQMDEIRKVVDDKKQWKIIGKGPNTNVYLGIYKNTHVAVKHFPYIPSENFESTEEFKRITYAYDNEY